MDRSDRELRLQEIKAEAQQILAFGRGWTLLQLFHEWASLCGHYQTREGLDRFFTFVEEGPDE